MDRMFYSSFSKSLFNATYVDYYKKCFYDIHESEECTSLWEKEELKIFLKYNGGIFSMEERAVF